MMNDAGAAGEPSSSMSEQLLRPLEELQTLAHTLFASLAPVQMKPPPPPSPSAFVDCNERLSRAVSVAYAHQVKQRQIEALAAEILALDAQWREVCTTLADDKRALEAILREGDERLSAIEQAREGVTFSSAPPNFEEPPPQVPGGPPSKPAQAFNPPFPNEVKMRSGRLGLEGSLGPLGETHSVGRPPDARTPGQDSGRPGHGANPYRQDIHNQPTQISLDFLDDLDLNPDL
ncbi:hypothetical protein HDZ31DRAFT_81634 [Schizophyllum fasciatum]